MNFKLNIATWIAIALALVVAFNVWPDLADRSRHYYPFALGFVLVAIALSFLMPRSRK